MIDHMNSPKSNPSKLGGFIRQHREDAGLGLREFSQRCGVPRGTLSKLENGQFAQPSSSLLATVANTLHLPLSDLYTAAGFDQAATLPSMPVYLRSQYKHLTPNQQAELTAQVLAVTQQYGIALDGSGPARGEDEQD